MTSEDLGTKYLDLDNAKAQSPTGTTEKLKKFLAKF